MSYKQSQQGSVLAVISAVIVILFVAALGYVLYQNMSKPKATEQSSQQAPKPDDLSAIAETAIAGWTIALKHPADWTIERSDITNESAEVARTTLWSKDKSIAVKVKMYSAPQLGGSCDVSTSTISYVKRAVLPGIQSAHFSEAIIHGQKTEYAEEGFTFSSGLVVKDAEIEGAVVGDDGCKLAWTVSDYFAKESDGSYESDVARSAVTIHVASLENSDETLKTFQSDQAIKDVLASDDYKMAVRIVQSYSQK